MKALLTKVKQYDPMNAETKAMLIKSNNLVLGIFTFFKYCLAAKKVPVKDGIFKEPITREMGSFGNKIIPAGV
jgi:hypothetical protein